MHLKGLKCWWNACFFIFSSWQTLTKHAQALRKTNKRKHDLHKTCTGIKKNKKKQSMIFTKPAQASKKTKKTKLLWSIDPQPWVDAQSFGFIGVFDACAGFVHLVVCFFWFFWCLCRFCDSNLHQTCTGIKKNKKNKTWSSQNLHRHQKKQKKNKTFVIYRPPTLSRCSEFCFFWFFWCLCRFCASSGLFFLVFLMPVQVLWL